MRSIGCAVEQVVSHSRRSSSPVTIRDVAHLARVSPATVSKVLNDGPYVSADARQRVLAAIDKLNYRPNTIARSLRKSHTATIGIVTDDLEGVFTMAMMRSIEEVASTQGFSVFLCNSYGEMARERAHLEVLLAKQVSGIILMSGYKVRERGAPALNLGSVPVVYLYQYTQDADVPCIIPDDMGGGALGTRHLLDLGRRRIAFINGPLHFEASQSRLSGYQQELATTGIAYDPALVRAGRWNEQSGYELAHELMALTQPPDAIFCASDSLAAGALDALHELQVRIPEDISVVGFDNRYFSSYQRPPLTTVALPLYEMGQRAGELLLKAIQGMSLNHEIYRVPCTLVRRLSCGASSD